MKKLLLFLLLLIFQQANAQTYMAVPSYSSATNTFITSTGNIKFYLNGISHTITVGHGANGVCFFGNNMFVSYDDGSNNGNGIIWYANVSFSTGSFTSDTPVILVNNQRNFSVATDAAGNIYCANYNGTVTKFIRAASAPFYSSANAATATFWSGGGFAEASGVAVDNATSTLWVVSYANNQAAVCKLNDFGNASKIKKINTNNGTYIQKPEGIAKDNLGNIWIGNNNNFYVLRINNAAVNTIITELNAANYSLKTLVETSDINDFAVTASPHQLGGIFYDDVYSSKLYVNDQLNNGNSFVYSFAPTNATPTFSATNFSQIFPGAGQCSIIPCSLLPKATASSTTISSGQTANLLASNCVTGATYLWKDAGATVATTPSFTTPLLTATKVYTVACNNGGSCVGEEANVTVTVSASCTIPANPTAASASPAIINSGQTSTLTASGCATGNTYLWKNGGITAGTGATIITPNLTSTTTYTAHCIDATCESTGTNVIVTVNTVSELNKLPNPSLVGYLHNWDETSNGMPYLQLDNVPSSYNVINYAFGVAQSGTTDNIQLTLPAEVDANPVTRTSTFIQKMNTLQNQGKKVLLSLGGSVGHGGVINVGTVTKRNNFITSVTNLLKTYPFDGLDIDIEAGSASNGTTTLIFNETGMTINTPNSPTIDNLIYALKEIMRNYRNFRGKKMLLTFAPERGMVAGGLSQFSHDNYETSAAYLPIITALKDSLDLVHTQLYGQGSDLGKTGGQYCAGTMANALAVTENLMLGYTLVSSQGTFSGLPSHKIALGLAALCTDAAGGGFLSASNIQSVVNYFRNTASQPAAETHSLCNSWMVSPQSTYTKISSDPVEFRGLMTWSINNDVKSSCGNNGITAAYNSLYAPFIPSTNAKNILTFSIPGQMGPSVINTTANTVTITMPSGTNLAALVPSFTISPDCFPSKISGNVADFSAPIQYTLNHTDNSSKTWTVIVNTSSTCSTPANPTAASASPATINSGQTSTLTAGGCATGNTYLWKNGGTTAGTGATIITPTLTSSTTYTAHCVDATCESTGTNVNVTVNGGTSGVTQNGSISVTSTLQTNNPRTRTFTFRLPKANPDCNRPLLIALHGDGGTGDGMMNSTGFNTVADAENFIVVYPNSSTINTGTQWNKFADATSGSGDNGNDPNAADDEKFIADLIDYFYLNYGTDRSKVYVTGHSGGGFMAYALVLSNQTKNKIAGVAPVAANLWANNSYANTQFATGTFSPTPILHIHATNDPTVPKPNLTGWTWQGRLAEATCGTGNNGTHTTTTISGVIDRHTFCGSTTPVIMMELKQAGLGHGWPTTANSTYHASLEIWNFLKNYSKGSYSVPNPIVTPTSVSISSGQSTTLTASSCPTGYGYKWSNGASTAAISVSPAATTNYTAYCTFGVGCQSLGTSASVTVTTGCTAPTISVEAITPIVSGFISNQTEYNNKLTATGCSGTITWSNGATTTSIDIPKIPTVGITYSATCTVGSCTSTAAYKTLTYVAPPAISATPLEMCSGQNATFTGSNCTGTVNWYRKVVSSSLYNPTFSYIGTGSSLVHPPTNSSSPGNTPFNTTYTSYTSVCVVNGVSSGIVDEISFSVTPMINVSPTLTNSGPVNSGQPVNLTATNLVPGGQSCSLAKGIYNSGQYITVSQDIPSDNFTIEMWFKTTQTDVGLFSAGSSSITNYTSDRHIYIDASGILRFRAEPVSNASFSSNVVVNNNIWHHVAVTHSSTSEISRIYIDGKLAATRTAINACFAEQVFRIGVSQEAGSNLFYTGEVDNVRIWNVVRTQNEIRQTAQLETPAVTTGLIYHAKLNGNANAAIGNTGVTTGHTAFLVGGGTTTVYPTYSNVNYYTYTWSGQNAPLPGTALTQSTTGAAGSTYTLNVTPSNLVCSTISGTTTVVINNTNPCPNAIVVTAGSYPNYTPNQVIQAAEYITTGTPPNVVINTSNSNNLKYQAGKSITLSPGFSVESGGVFEAKIGGCL